MEQSEILKQFDEFLKTYDEKIKNDIWHQHSQVFQDFWNSKIMTGKQTDLQDEEIDKIVRILDRHGKGNTKNDEAVANIMIAQGMLRRMFKDIKSSDQLKNIINRVFTAKDDPNKIAAVDELYKVNPGRNSLTGSSGNAISAFLAAYEPFTNIGVVSLSHRKMIIEKFGFQNGPDFEKDSPGKKIIMSNMSILNGFKALGISNGARTISRFLYTSLIKEFWQADLNKIRVSGKKEVSVSIPENEEIVQAGQIPTSDKEQRESIKVQAKLAEIGEKLGMKIWVPRNDRAGVLGIWGAKKESLLDELPLVFDDTTLKTIKNIDVLWIRRRSIVRAFEVEDTTSIYSGILRMADLLALQPMLDIKIHIVAPVGRRDEVFKQIARPVFAVMEKGPLSELCSYISYDSIYELAKEKRLEHMTDTIIDEYVEPSED